MVWVATVCKDLGKDAVADSVGVPCTPTPQTCLISKILGFFCREKERLGVSGGLGDSSEAHHALRLLSRPLAWLASHLGTDP